MRFRDLILPSLGESWWSFVKSWLGCGAVLFVMWVLAWVFLQD